MWLNVVFLTMDWDLTCRVCLEGGDMVSLFDCDENNELLRDKYKYTTGIEVVEADSLPTLICLACVDRLMFAYQFRQQCITSNETLKECVSELTETNAAISNKFNAAGSEAVKIKQEDGVYLQYELPVEHVGGLKATPRRGRGRPRKYPNQQGEIVTSPYQRKTQLNVSNEEPSLSTILASGGINLKEEPREDDTLDFLLDEGIDHDHDDDPDYEPNVDQPPSEEPPLRKTAPPKKKRGRPAKKPPAGESQEDILLKETIMAYSEPLVDSVVKPPKPKKRKTPTKKRYSYDKIHTCDTCGNSFRSNASLQAHIRRHLGIKPFVCSVCGYSCVINIELRRHMRRHTGQKPYKCRICERHFGDFGTRQKHERLHLGERPYQCSLCGKSFTYSYVLSNHMLTHTGEKKYSCAPCNRKFTKAHHLKYHNKVHHKDVYIQQQFEMEAKRIREQIKIKDLSKVFATGQFLQDGHRVQILQTEGEGGEMQLQVVDGAEGEATEEADEGGGHTDGSAGGEVHYEAYVEEEEEQNQMDMNDMGVVEEEEDEEEAETIVGDLHTDSQ